MPFFNFIFFISENNSSIHCFMESNILSFIFIPDHQRINFFYLIIKNYTTFKTEKGNNDINLNNIHSFWDYRKDEFLISAIKFLIATTIWGLI